VAEQAAAKKRQKVPKARDHHHSSTPDAPNVLNGAITQQGLTADEMGFGVKLHGNNLGLLMSALDQKRTSEHVRAMSALPPKADIRERDYQSAKCLTVNDCDYGQR
jgi:hypothetical protein